MITFMFHLAIHEWSGLIYKTQIGVFRLKSRLPDLIRMEITHHSHPSHRNSKSSSVLIHNQNVSSLIKCCVYSEHRVCYIPGVGAAVLEFWSEF